VWEELGLGAPPDVRPLYLGKAEASLAGRDVSTHFGYVREGRRTSVTGYSTLRRSLAALLRDVRGFRAQPRSVAKPGHYASYGLSSAQDEELSAWMRERLRLSCWEMSHEIAVPELGLVERAVFRRLLPPLNLADIVTPWRPRVVAARQAMTAEARAWRASDWDHVEDDPELHPKVVGSIPTRPTPGGAATAEILCGAPTGGRSGCGSAYAATTLGPNNSVGSAQVVNGSLQKKDLSKKAIAALKGNRGPAGPAGSAGTAGPQGAKGDKGDTGATGPSDAFAGFKNGPVSVPFSTTAYTILAHLTLPAGKYVIFGTTNITNNAGSGYTDARCQLAASTGDFDEAEVALEDVNVVGSAHAGSMAMNVVADMSAAAGSVDLRCRNEGTGVSNARFIKISAIRVGTLSNTALS
jgi:hypothetical protein